MTHKARLAFLFCALAMLALDGRASPGATGTIRVDASKFRNQQGVLGCSIFSSGEGFPARGALRSVRVPISGESATCTFDGIAAGTYAVSVLHDENRNGRLDKNLLSMPTEGYGVSNDHTRAMGPPRWEPARFSLGAGETKTLSIALRY